MKISLRNAALLLLLFSFAVVNGQMMNPVHFKSEMKTTKGLSRMTHHSRLALPSLYPR